LRVARRAEVVAGFERERIREAATHGEEDEEDVVICSATSPAACAA
jgi:hypothetical protein